MLAHEVGGSNAKAEVVGWSELPGKSNHFIGNDQKRWRMNIRQFAKVRAHARIMRRPEGNQ